VRLVPTRSMRCRPQVLHTSQMRPVLWEALSLGIARQGPLR
jgi:hypothetical protein